MHVKLLRPVNKFDKLKQEVLDLCERLNPVSNQIICQTIEEHDDDWTCGIGRIDDLDEKDETLYKHINKNLKNTEIEKLILNYSGFRSRIMILPPKQCYSIHADPTLRIHIPITTNDQCWMVWPEYNDCQHMYSGGEYLTDTTKKHTFINGSTQPRIHLVIVQNLLKIE